MADLLTHVLVGYLVGVALRRLGRLADRYVPLAMVGAVLPDLMRPALLLGVVRGDAPVPYSFWGVHTLGGVVVLAALGALTLHVDRRVGFLTLVAGGASHLLLDGLVVRADGQAPPYLFPVTDWLPPAGNLYTSGDLPPLLVALAVAVPVWLWRRRVSTGSDAEGASAPHSED